MDANRFDTLTRSLTTTGSRRRALGAVLGGSLGLLGLAHPDAAEAGGECKPRCGECATCKKGACRKTKHGKKCKKGTCQAKANGTGCSTGTCQGGSCTITVAPAPTCGDGVKNGSETGVDCGGSCPRCSTGQACLSRNDCSGAVCSAGTCQACTFGTQCGDAGNPSSCNCGNSGRSGSSTVCFAPTVTGQSVTSCTQCPLDRACFTYGGGLFCDAYCGAA